MRRRPIFLESYESESQRRHFAACKRISKGDGDQDDFMALADAVLELMRWRQTVKEREAKEDKRQELQGQTR